MYKVINLADKQFEKHAEEALRQAQELAIEEQMRVRKIIEDNTIWSSGDDAS